MTVIPSITMTLLCAIDTRTSNPYENAGIRQIGGGRQ